MQNLLITGGSGFLGKHLGIRLKDRFNVYLGSRNNKQNSIAEKTTGCKVVPMDVTNIESVRDCFREVNPEIVVHAAATKFVDLSEKFPLEAVDVNVIGSQNVARVSMDSGVNFVLGISTDKASPPVRNMYGLTKATMEKMFCLLNGKTSTKFACVRYGNVAWSTGSVLPIWKSMFDSTKVIGTTGPEMRRFFFTIDEAVELVITAINNNESISGKVLSRSMKSAKISDILRVWVNNFGGRWEKIEGRPGERLDEYLVGELELQFSEKVCINDTTHFIISPNVKSDNPLTEIFGSHNAPPLSDVDIFHIINNPPTIL